MSNDRCEICDRLFTIHTNQHNSVVRQDGSEFGHDIVCGDCVLGMESEMYRIGEDEMSAEPTMIVLVFGGRDFSNTALMEQCLTSLGVENIALIVHGDARGADRMAGEWATRHGVHSAKVPALWEQYPYKAGFKRNAIMLKLNITHAVMFPGGNGTAHMCKLCEEAGIPLWKIQ